ncbi:MAG: DUF1553 domain-containing protein [Planctomyces sp.]|nr:DUF1553 domain-containing protein [Planctomyces sp.]
MRCWLWPLAAFALLLIPAAPAIAAEDVSLSALRIEPDLGTGKLSLRGRDARVQLLVTGEAAGGRLLDVTDRAQWTAEPEGIVRIDETGLMTPLADGVTTITAAAAGNASRVEVQVSDVATQVPVHFTNQVVPVFTKLGCNGGGCHGKASGQNGFKLSLLGFYPEDDYEFLVKEGRGRRLFPNAPERSLLLQKGAGQSPHGGGKRMEADSYEYRLLYRWIEQGMPHGQADDPVVTGIKCYPSQRVLDRNGRQQLAVLATYSDGSVDDVTRMALFEPNDTELAESSVTGLVSTHDLAGEVAIMARYQGQVSTFRATIPLGLQVAETPPVANFVDEHVFGKLKVLGVPPSPLADDATYLRRVSIDVAGRLPTEQEVREFLSDPLPDKRARLVDRLLDSPEYADLFANKWNAVLRNKKRQDEDAPGTLAFHQWIWNSLYENKPYDEFVGELLTASGDVSDSPPVVWYREVAETNQQVEDVAQLFLGIRIQCARCHHHPFEKWSQDDYFGFAAFFSRVGKKNLAAGNSTQSRDRRVFHNVGLAQAANPRSGKPLPPTGLGSEPLSVGEERDPRLDLVHWMAEPENPFFARALVNRYWKHFFDRGIVEPEDDMRETNPPTNPELLEALAQHFVDSGFDLKQLVRTICQSSSYQLTALPNDDNLRDKQNFSRYYPKRLTAEVLYDAFHQVTNSSQGYSGLPAGTRAVQLPETSAAPYFLKVFGQPQGDTACECERSQEANLAQSLHLLNSSEVQNKIGGGGGRAATLAADASRSTEEKVRELYRWVYAREPVAEEVQIALTHIEKHKDAPQTAWEDILWALVNTKEFLFNH